MKRLKGAFALAFLFEGEDDLLIGARHGSPLAVGRSDEGVYLGSDALALAPFATSIAYLDEGDWVTLTRDGVRVHDANDNLVDRRFQPLLAGSFLIDKGNYRHFMAKEIHEQPEVVGRTLAHYLDLAEGVVRLPFEFKFDPRTLSRVTISACGTAYYAGLVARYWLERFARLSSNSRRRMQSAETRSRNVQAAHCGVVERTFRSSSGIHRLFRFRTISFVDWEIQSKSLAHTRPTLT